MFVHPDLCCHFQLCIEAAGHDLLEGRSQFLHEFCKMVESSHTAMHIQTEACKTYVSGRFARLYRRIIVNEQSDRQASHSCLLAV